ncbi:SdpI family protein [Actinokineospora sp. HUAS TT18]|uniref:SdpI family protein n=1 Tax=Actinokineospora sp. HUAS TT18 TaxID=3447451 RepID=UPI003F5238BF
MNLVSLLPLIVGLPLLVVGFLGLTERLPRNRFGGVRTPATLRSDEAFRVGNKVAGLPNMVAGSVGVIGGVIGLTLHTGALMVVLIATVGLLAITLGAGVLGHRAASAVPEPAPELPPGCAGCQCGAGGCGALSKA